VFSLKNNFDFNIFVILNFCFKILYVCVCVFVCVYTKLTVKDIILASDAILNNSNLILLEQNYHEIVNTVSRLMFAY